MRKLQRFHGNLAAVGFQIRTRPFDRIRLLGNPRPHNRRIVGTEQPHRNALAVLFEISRYDLLVPIPKYVGHDSALQCQVDVFGSFG